MQGPRFPPGENPLRSRHLSDLFGLPFQYRTGQGQQVRAKHVILPWTDGCHRVGGAEYRVKAFEVVEYNTSKYRVYQDYEVKGDLWE